MLKVKAHAGRNQVDGESPSFYANVSEIISAIKMHPSVKALALTVESGNRVLPWAVILVWPIGRLSVANDPSLFSRKLSRKFRPEDCANVWKRLGGNVYVCLSHLTLQQSIV